MMNDTLVQSFLSVAAEGSFCKAAEKIYISQPNLSRNIARLEKELNAQKLMRGLLIACAKRPIAPEQLGALIDSIEAELRNASKNEIGSKELGDMALVRLAKLDDVAYVRFASVYKDFQNIEEFAAALEGLK